MHSLKESRIHIFTQDTRRTTPCCVKEWKRSASRSFSETNTEATSSRPSCILNTKTSTFPSSTIDCLRKASVEEKHSDTIVLHFLNLTIGGWMYFNHRTSDLSGESPQHRLLPHRKHRTRFRRRHQNTPSQHSPSLWWHELSYEIEEWCKCHDLCK